MTGTSLDFVTTYRDGDKECNKKRKEHKREQRLSENSEIISFIRTTFEISEGILRNNTFIIGSD